MSEPNDTETQEELDPALQRVQMRLKRLMLRSTLIMVLGLSAVVAAIIYKINQSAEQEAGVYQVPDVVTQANLRRLDFPLPSGAILKATSLQGNNLVVSFQHETGAGVLMVDVQSWQVHSILTLPANQ